MGEVQDPAAMAFLLPTGHRVFFWSDLLYLSRFLRCPPHCFPSSCSNDDDEDADAASNCTTTSSTTPSPSSSPSSGSSSLSPSKSSPSSAPPSSTPCFTAVVYGCRVQHSLTIFINRCCFPTCIDINIYCPTVFPGCNLLCHFAVLLLHFSKGGCNGIRAWAFNSILHAASLRFIKCYDDKLRLTGLPRDRDDDYSNHSTTNFGASTTTTTTTHVVARKDQ